MQALHNHSDNPAAQASRAHPQRRRKHSNKSKHHNNKQLSGTALNTAPEHTLEHHFSQFQLQRVVEPHYDPTLGWILHDTGRPGSAGLCFDHRARLSSWQLQQEKGPRRRAAAPLPHGGRLIAMNILQ